MAGNMALRGYFERIGRKRVGPDIARSYNVSLVTTGRLQPRPFDSVAASAGAAL
jgi:hypothetical protein